MITDIIIIKYNNPLWENLCMDSVKYWTVPEHDITIHDNYPENENIGRLWNRIINISRGKYICLLNSDTLVQKDWLNKLLDVFNVERNVGAVGPSTNNSKNIQSSSSRAFYDYEIEDMKGYETLSGFCLLFPKLVWSHVGGFPENFGFYGQEVAFLDGVRGMGYREVWRKDAFVWHYGSATVKKEQAEGKFDELKERRKAREKVAELRKP